MAWAKETHNSNEDLMDIMNYAFHCRKRAYPDHPWGTLKIYEMRHGFRELGLGEIMMA